MVVSGLNLYQWWVRQCWVVTGEFGTRSFVLIRLLRKRK